MKTQRKLLYLLLASAVALAGFSACSQTEIPLVTDDNSADLQALQKLIDADESLESFTPNYDEEDVMDLLTDGLSKEIFPVRVGQKMKRVDKALDVVFEGDTASGTITKSFEGMLLIAASYDAWSPGDSNVVDTLIKKPFNTTVTRNVVFVKIANTDNPEDNWKISSISLPAGGTGSDNFDITNLAILMPGGTTYEISSPLDYYLQRGVGKKRQVPNLFAGQAAIIKLTVKTAYADTGFVTLTHGANKKVKKRVKRKFKVISESFDGQFYTRVYEGKFRTHFNRGHFHAVLNVLPRQVIFDDTSPVEEVSWGIPYFVK